jgi:hypothetical protein
MVKISFKNLPEIQTDRQTDRQTDTALADCLSVCTEFYMIIDLNGLVHRDRFE